MRGLETHKTGWEAGKYIRVRLQNCEAAFETKVDHRKVDVIVHMFTTKPERETRGEIMISHVITGNSSTMMFSHFCPALRYIIHLARRLKSIPPRYAA